MPTNSRNTESANETNNEDSKSSFIDKDETVPTNSRNTDSANETNNEDSQSSFIDEDDTSEKSMTTESCKHKNFSNPNQIFEYFGFDLIFSNPIH